MGPTARRRLRRQTEGDLIIRLMRHMRIDVDLNGAFEALAHDLMRVLSARRILVAAQETAGARRTFLWSVDRAAEGSGVSVRVTDTGPLERPTYFFPAPSQWCAIRHDRVAEASSFDVLVGDGSDIAGQGDSRSFIPERFAASHLSRSAMSVCFKFGTDWTCRLFVLDAKLGEQPGNTLRFLGRMVHELGQAGHNVYQFHQLQSGAVAKERESLARALHDEFIQSLIGAEMRLHAVQKSVADPAVAAELHRIEEILHEDVLGVRDLMQRIKPLHVEPEDLLEFLADHVRKFASITGIRASFVADVRDVDLPARICTVVSRIVQEALSNARKHSGAARVVVHLSQTGNRWMLIVEDNGRGLSSGPAQAEPVVRMSGRHVFGGARPGLPGGRAWQRAPAVIRDCVRSLDGELDLRVAAGGGLGLEIRFNAPAGSQAVHGNGQKILKAAAGV